MDGLKAALKVVLSVVLSVEQMVESLAVLMVAWWVVMMDAYSATRDMIR